MSRNRKSTEARVAVGGIVAALVLACGLVAPRAAQAQSFTLIGAAPNSAYSRAFAVSADGRTAVGASFRDSTPAFQAGWQWSAQTGRVDTGLSSEFPQYSAFLGASADASVVVGYAAGADARPTAIRYSGPGTYQNLGRLAGHNGAHATGVSGDGSVVVGRSYFLQQGTEVTSSAFRWTAEGGMQAITSAFSRAYGVSADGNTIVGEVRDGSGINAFRWTSESGLQVLPRLPGTLSSTANAVTASGSTAVGYSGNVAAMWQGASVVPLTTPLPGVRETVATSVNADGTVVGAHIAFPTTATAGIWTSQTGIIRMSDFLASHGVDVPSGLNLEYCTGISADGNTFVGWCSGGSMPQGFVATIPAPGSAGLLAAWMLAGRRRRARG